MTHDQHTHEDAGARSALHTRTVRWEGERRDRPSKAVVEAVAEATETPQEDLGPLFGVVDPDALDALFEHTEGRSPAASNGFVTFEYEGCVVRVGADGRVIVDPAPNR